MSVTFTNNSRIAIYSAVWLLTDDYDYQTTPNYISVTTLLKPLKQIILAKRLNRDPSIQRNIDISSLIKSKIGTACHDSIERAWESVESRKKALALMGVPEKVADKIRVNPTEEDLKEEDIIPIYMETRTQKEINGFVIGGKFDLIFEGRLVDHKSTSTFTYEKGVKEEDYQMQGSIYRWLNDDKVTHDHMYINFIFTDWKRAMAMANLKYPQSQIMEHPIPLLSLEETERQIINKTDLIRKYMDSDEKDIPPCTDEELWRSAFVWKYYKNPENKTRSTKNYDNEGEAHDRWIADGRIGIVEKTGGEVKACCYCPAYEICTQKDEYLKSGELNPII